MKKTGATIVNGTPDRRLLVWVLHEVASQPFENHRAP
jgi:hypothetical protein